jgi:hypothetical protein
MRRIGTALALGLTLATVAVEASQAAKIPTIGDGAHSDVRYAAGIGTYRVWP